MFKNASQLLDEAPEACFRWHALGFRWDSFQPRFTVRDTESQDVKDLELQEWDWFVSEVRRCTGSWQDGLHIPCPHTAEVGRFSSCRDCDPFPVQECVFEPRCDGSSCKGAICAQEHSVYISFFGTSPKVGMTRSSRIRSRGIEQGADAIIPVIHCRNRLEARQAEKELSAAMAVRQAVTAKDFARSLTHKVPYEEITARTERMLRDNNLEDGGLTILDEYPIPVVERTPLPMPTPGRHRGKVMGFKGRFMLYRDQTGQPKLLDLSDTVSRFLGTAPCRSVQRTLF